jgi:hypothetical protein
LTQLTRDSQVLKIDSFICKVYSWWKSGFNKEILKAIPDERLPRTKPENKNENKMVICRYWSLEDNVLLEDNWWNQLTFPVIHSNSRSWFQSLKFTHIQFSILWPSYYSRMTHESNTINSEMKWKILNGNIFDSTDQISHLENNKNTKVSLFKYSQSQNKWSSDHKFSTDAAWLSMSGNLFPWSSYIFPSPSWKPVGTPLQVLIRTRVNVEVVLTKFELSSNILFEI